jgi:hypothetical protein
LPLQVFLLLYLVHTTNEKGHCKTEVQQGEESPC